MGRGGEARRLRRFITLLRSFARSQLGPIRFFVKPLSTGAFGLHNVRLGSTADLATGWTGMDESTPSLQEVVPEINANSVNFYGGRGIW